MEKAMDKQSAKYNEMQEQFAEISSKMTDLNFTKFQRDTAASTADEEGFRNAFNMAKGAKETWDEDITAMDAVIKGEKSEERK